MIEILNIQDENGYGLMHGRYDVLAKLPDGATNGDMIKAMFPNLANSNLELIDVLLNTKSWWNSPYKKEVEE
jgi:hypothetical protein